MLSFLFLTLFETEVPNSSVDVTSSNAVLTHTFWPPRIKKSRHTTMQTPQPIQHKTKLIHILNPETYMEADPKFSFAVIENHKEPEMDLKVCNMSPLRIRQIPSGIFFPTRGGSPRRLQENLIDDFDAEAVNAQEATSEAEFNRNRDRINVTPRSSPASAP